MKNNIVKVTLWGQNVGELYWDAHDRCAYFNYFPEFIARGLDIAPLTASITKPALRHGEVYKGNKDRLYQGLPEFLADSLPDDWGKRVMRHWQSQYDRNVSLTPVDALSLMGKRAMGALEFEPSMKDWEQPFDIELSDLYHLAEKIMLDHETPVGQIEDMPFSNLFKVGTSAGGKRPKAIIAINEETGDVISGQVLLSAEYKHYILKFNEHGSLPMTQLEKTYYDMATSSGIRMMPSRLIEVGGVHHFLTERFDRCDGDKIYTQTLAALDPDAESYEDLFAVARKLGTGMSDFEQLFRQAVFNILSSNLDDHSKNFSFCMSKDGRWSVSPAYDICFTYDLTGMGFSNHHELSLNGKTREFERNDLIVFGQQNDISQPEKILDHVCSVLSDFRKYAKENGISETVSDIIQKHLDHNMGIDREQLETTTVSQLPEGIVLSRISITSNKKGRALTIEVNNRHRMSKPISSEDYIAQRVGLLSKEKLALKYFKEEIGAISKES